MALVDRLGSVVELGVVVDVEISGPQRFSFAPDTFSGARPRGPLMLWSENEAALVWFLGVNTPRQRPLDDSNTPAGDIFRRWTRGREPSRQRTYADVNPTGRLQTLRPPAIVIRYLSDKFNRRAAWVLYKHHFGAGVRLSVQGEGDEKLYMVRGGELRITEDGIEG